MKIIDISKQNEKDVIKVNIIYSNDTDCTPWCGPLGGGPGIADKF